MSKRKTSKYKIDRRLGINLWGRPKSPFNRREHGPGEHGRRRKKQFHGYYEEAVRRRGDTGENLIELLERRLDAVVYRMKFVPTIFSARQVVNHGHIRVNGKRVNIPSYQVKDGDVISVKDKSREMPLVLEAIASSERDIPDYLDVDLDKLQGTYVRGPKLADVPYPVQMEPNLVIEFYSL